MSAKETPSLDTYALATSDAAARAAPDLPYRPLMPKNRTIPIAVVGAGGISAAHLDAYRAHGLNVVAIVDRHIERAQARRDAFFPSALATDAVDEVIARADIPVVDLTMHVKDRTPLVRQALEAGKHVLSQKPFVTDLREGEALAALAEAKGLKLAVNQNGRWAPHLSYMREAVAAGLVGDVLCVQIAIHWDHSWVKGTPFSDMPFLILEDFGIHWFDFLASLIGAKGERVFASAARASGQEVKAPLLSQALVDFKGGQASLTFDGAAPFGPSDTTVIAGAKGTLRSFGPNLGRQRVELYTCAGVASPSLEGQWFNDGFAGAMGALLSAIETGLPPLNAARENLTSLRLAHAAIDSAKAGKPIRIH